MSNFRIVTSPEGHEVLINTDHVVSVTAEKETNVSEIRMIDGSTIKATGNEIESGMFDIPAMIVPAIKPATALYVSRKNATDIAWEAPVVAWSIQTSALGAITEPVVPGIDDMSLARNNWARAVEMPQDDGVVIIYEEQTFLSRQSFIAALRVECIHLEDTAADKAA